SPTSPTTPCMRRWLRYLHHRRIYQRDFHLCPVVEVIPISSVMTLDLELLDLCKLVIQIEFILQVHQRLSLRLNILVLRFLVCCKIQWPINIPIDIERLKLTIPPHTGHRPTDFSECF